MHNPPKILLGILRRLCRDEFLESVEGDLIALYHRRYEQRGRLYANLCYLLDVIQFLQPFFLRFRIKNTNADMYKSYFKIIFRNILKKKLFSGINLLGMSLALGIVMATFAFVSHESSYDSYHSKQDRIYRVTYRYNNQNGYDISWARVVQPWVNELEEVFPEVEELVRFQTFRPRNVKIGINKFREKYAFSTDAAVFDVFDFQFVSGDPQTALKEPYSVVLTESIAKKYFGEKQPLGEAIEIYNDLGEKETHKVTAVIKDQPSNTHMPVNFLSTINSPEERAGWAYTYILLKENAKIGSVEHQIDQFIADRVDENPEFLTYSFQPLSDIHLHSDLSREIKANGNYDYLLIFSLIALFLLAIATINFANLNTVQLLNKTREIGIRKVIGARKSNLKFYMYLEAFVLTMIGGVIGMGLFWLMLTPLENFVGYQLSFSYSMLILGLLTIVLFVSLLAGVYPAQVISGLQPILALKGKLNKRVGSKGTKTFLVGLQFAISAALMSGTLIFQKQFHYIQNAQLGYDQQQVLAIMDIPNEVSESYEILKTSLLEIPGVADVSASLEIPTRPIKDQGMVRVSGREQDEENLPSADIQVIDINALELLDIELVAGEQLPQSIKNINKKLNESESIDDYMQSNRKAYLLNETAVKLLGWENPEEALANEISWSIGNIRLAQGPVVGVVKDFHQESFKTTIDPLVMTYEPIWLRQVLVKVDSDNYFRIVDRINQQWNDLFPDIPMETSFLDSEFEKLYQSEQKQFVLIAIITIITVFIAFLGVFGLINFTVRLRLHEMAVRKVLGARFVQIFNVLGKEYIVLNLVSMLLTVPVVWYFMNDWLENYAYHIEIGPIGFGISILSISLILLSTIFFQTRKASIRNPAEILRND